MSSRNKIVFFIGGTCLILIVIFFIVTNVFLLGRFVEIEQRDIHQNLLRFLDVLDNELFSLKKIGVDWGSWDDTYYFIGTKDPGYIKSNLPDSTFIELGLNLIFYLDKSGHLVYGKVYDLQAEKEIVDSNLFKLITTKKALLSNTSITYPQTGIVLLPEGPPLLVTIHPILTSQGKGPSKGILIMGRFLDNVEIKKIAKIIHLLVKIHRYDELPKQLKSQLLNQKESILIKTLNNKEIMGYAVVNDISGQPALITSVKLPRTIYRQGQAGIRYFLLAFIGVMVIFLLEVLMLLEKIHNSDSFS